MRRVTLANLRAHKLRLLLTSLAIALGVGFVSGTLTLTDMMRAGAYQQFASGAQQVDTAVLSQDGSEKLPARALEKVRSVPGVRAADGQLRGPAPLLGRDGKAVGDQATLGVAVDPDNPAATFEITKGRAPTGRNEAILTEQTAQRAKYQVGDTIRVLDQQQRKRSFRLVGIVDLGTGGMVAVRGAVGFLPGVAAGMTGMSTYSQINAVAAEGVTESVLAKRVAAALGDDYEVLPGQEYADRKVDQALGDLQVYTTGLLLFGVIALFVATLVIYNTFQILIAQRMREVALLRCVGGTRRQVFAGVLVESAAVGLAASAFGLVLGYGFTFGLSELVSLLGGRLPAVQVTFSPTAVVVALAAGLSVTVVSALIPAWKATRVAPVAALQAQPEQDVRGFRASVLRILTAVVLAGGGAALTALGMLGEPGQQAMMLVAAGGIVLFFGVLALAPLLVGPLGRAIGWLPAKLFGVPARLAAENTGRNPKRTATTTVALTVGVGLVALFTVISSTMQTSLMQNLEQKFPVDFTISATMGTGQENATLPAGLATKLRNQPQLDEVVAEHRIDAGIAGKERPVGAVTPAALGNAVKLTFTAGSLEQFDRGSVIMYESIAGRLGVNAGERVPLETADGTVQVEVAGIYTTATPISGVLMPQADFARYYGQMPPASIYVNAAEGVASGDARRIVEQAAQPYPLAQVQSTAALEEQVTEAYDALLGIVAALLGLSIIIAVVGIANTLSLSVLERTRESALLRALGLTRGQLRRMLRTEAVITAVMGALVGVGLGLLYGWFAGLAALGPDKIVFSARPWLLAGYFVLAAVIGVVASLLPARRAAKTSVVSAMSAE